MITLWLLACGGAPEPKPAPPPPKHVMVVVIDTLRADVVNRVDTPILDALAEEGDAVERAWSPSTWTVPSVISMFNGMPVRQHGWNRGTGNAREYPPIPEHPVLAEVLKGEGFATDGLYANDFLRGELGFSRGFDTWRRVPDAAMPGRISELTASWDDDKRHFLYVHPIGPHSPLRPTTASAEKYAVEPAFLEDSKGFLVGVCKRNRKPGAREHYKRAYHAVVEDTDTLLGELLDALGEHRKDTAILVTSDHGELLGEHGICAHGYWVYEELTHVPLVAVGMGELPDTLSGASVPDLVTTSLGVEHEWATPRDAAVPLVSTRQEWMAVSDGRLKGRWDRKGFHVNDLTTDPDESTHLPEHEAAMTAIRSEWEARVPAGTLTQPDQTLDPKTTEQLKALGYADGDESSTE